jgi:hypothetical protein
VRTPVAPWIPVPAPASQPTSSVASDGGHGATRADWKAATWAARTVPPAGPGGPGRCGGRRGAVQVVPAQHRLLQQPEPGAGVDAALLPQVPGDPLVLGQRVGPPAATTGVAGRTAGRKVVP